MHRTLKAKALDAGRASGQLLACAVGMQLPLDVAQCLASDASVLIL
jgi:hypothetical protein